MSALDVPIYITETGIADAAGDRRPLWLETYIPEVERAVRDGMDVRGLMYWTLVDNFEVSNWSSRVMLYTISRSELASLQNAEVLPVCWAWATPLMPAHGERSHCHAEVIPGAGRHCVLFSVQLWVHVYHELLSKVSSLWACQGHKSQQRQGKKQPCKCPS